MGPDSSVFYVYAALFACITLAGLHIGMKVFGNARLGCAMLISCSLLQIVWAALAADVGIEDDNSYDLLVVIAIGIQLTLQTATFLSWSSDVGESNIYFVKILMSVVNLVTICALIAFEYKPSSIDDLELGAFFFTVATCLLFAATGLKFSVGSEVPVSARLVLCPIIIGGLQSFSVAMWTDIADVQEYIIDLSDWLTFDFVVLLCNVIVLSLFLVLLAVPLERIKAFGGNETQQMVSELGDTMNNMVASSSPISSRKRNLSETIGGAIQYIQERVGRRMSSTDRVRSPNISIVSPINEIKDGDSIQDDE